jgi:uncharacterized protein YutE (UPF0331/DUF86 family)
MSDKEFMSMMNRTFNYPGKYDDYGNFINTKDAFPKESIDRYNKIKSFVNTLSNREGNILKHPRGTQIYPKKDQLEMFKNITGKGVREYYLEHESDEEFVNRLLTYAIEDNIDYLNAYCNKDDDFKRVERFTGEKITSVDDIIEFAENNR